LPRLVSHYKKYQFNTMSRAVLGLALTALLPFASSRGDELFFREKVEPVLKQHCYSCHSLEAEKIKGGLLLDSKEATLRGGDTGPALNPGDPDNSKIIIAIRHTDPDLQMPPKEKIPDDQIALLEQWVKMGAPDPRLTPAPDYKQKDLWSTKPITSPAIPQVKNSKWVRDPIDAFILAELEKRDLAPAAPADARTLIRRVSFDLLGLPPEPKTVEEFAANGGENALPSLIDEALRSPHFGERWGRHWLDIARYADSNGLDQNTLFDNAWRYRDWVIEAFNNDKPYDQFIREQIAGDLLPATTDKDRHQKWIATGFLMLGPKNFFEPNREKLLMDIADEQIDVTSRAFLGLTVSCARCHDHKFDPIPTKDYYALAGIFRSSQTLGSDGSGGGPRFLPVNERPLGTMEQISAFEKYEADLARLEAKRDAARQLARDLPGGIDSKHLDGIVLDNLDAEVVGKWTLSNYSTNFVDKNYLHDGNERREKGKSLVRFRPEVPQEGLYEIRLAYTARFNRATNVPVRVTSKGSERTVFLNQTVLPPHDKAFETLGTFMLAQGTNNTVEVLTEGTRGFVVVDALQLLPQDVQLAGKLMKKRSAPAQPEAIMMADVSAADLQQLEYDVMDLAAQPPPGLENGMPRALAVKDSTPRNSKIHIRGDPERLGQEVPRGFLSLIEHVETGQLGTDSSGRLELARWIADSRNPLTARVAVNRIWQHLMGRPLVNTPDNFGSMGEAPTHPELLDYLASEFMNDQWSTKRFIRRLMLTSTYQMSSAHNTKAHGIDPENIYFWRAHRKRLDAESLRDAILAINGTLDRTFGGNSLDGNQPAQPARNQQLEDLTRRSVYLPVLRGNVNELFQVFDFPDPHALAAKRFVTTAPTQALFLMNSSFAAEQSRLWAEQLLSDSGKSTPDWIALAYLSAYSRRPSPAEIQRAEQFLLNFERALAPAEQDPAVRKQKAVQAFCHALIQSTEFRFLN
jgi:mono/diheme cytochrome c family protein